MSIKTFETQSTANILYSTHWWRTRCWMKLHSNASNLKIWLDEPEKVEQIVWSRTNFIQHQSTRILSSISFFINFARSQMHSTFRPTLKIYDVGWNVECICFGLKVFAVFLRYALLQYSVPITFKLLLEKLLLVSDQSLLHVWLNHNDLATLMIFCTVI